MGALLQYEQYMPHGMCLLWEPWLVLLWSGSDLLIFLSYMMIPCALLLVLRRRPDIRHRGLVSLFAGFILLCGITHALSIVTLWYAIYPLMGMVKLATGLVSLATAIALFRLVPTVVRIPSPERHEHVIEELKVTLAELSAARDELEERVRLRTHELKEANLRLSYLARDAVQRSRNLIHVVSSLTRPGEDTSSDPAQFMRELRGRINSLAIATSTVMERGERTGALLERVIRRQIEPMFTQPGSALVIEGPEVKVGAQGAQQISLVMWELASLAIRFRNGHEHGIRVAVSWSIEDEPVPALPDAPQNKGTLHLEWRDLTLAAISPPSNDPGEAPAAAQGSAARPDDANAQRDDPPGTYPVPEFSSDLLTRIMPRVVGGEANMRLDADQFVFTLSCPLASIKDYGDDEGTVWSDDGQLLRGAF